MVDKEKSQNLFTALYVKKTDIAVLINILINSEFDLSWIKQLILEYNTVQQYLSDRL